MSGTKEAKYIQQRLYALTGKNGSVKHSVNIFFDSLGPIPMATLLSLQRILFDDVSGLMTRKGKAKFDAAGKSGQDSFKTRDRVQLALHGLTRVFAQIPFDPAYETHRNRHNRTFPDALRQHRDICELGREWGSYDSQKRESGLKRIVDLHNTSFSDGHVTFPPIENIIICYGCENKDAASYKANVIFIYPDTVGPLAGFWDNFEMSASCVVHESRHYQQDHIGRLAGFDDIPESSAFYQQGKIFRDYWGHHPGQAIRPIYVPFDVSEEAYDAHPIERDAHAAERTVGSFMKTINKRRPGIPPRYIFKNPSPR